MSANAIYPRLFTKLFASPLMLHAPVRATFERELISQISAQRSGVSQPKAAAESERQYRQSRVFQKVGSVAVVSIEGVIDKRVSMMDLDCYGGCDLADVDNALNQAADPSIKSVLLYVNTPGGSVTGTPETAARLAELAKMKPVEAYVDVMACSAGYYIASQATRIVATPSAIIGSIGVYMAILDMSRALEMSGIREHVIKAGKWKDTGSPYRALTDEEHERLQAGVTRMHAQFKAAVKSKRPKVQDSTMEGQWMDGTEADELYLVDELTNETPDERISRMLV
jgi:signal peptide peptidase SppA